MKLRLVLKEEELKSMAETELPLQETPEKRHGFWLLTQFWNWGGGFGREALKLRSCRVSR